MRGSRYPPGYSLAICLVGFSKPPLQGRLFVEQHPQMTKEDGDSGEESENRCLEKYRLANQSQSHKHIHWVSHVTIWSFDHQLFWRIKWRRCSFTCERK